MALACILCFSSSRTTSNTFFLTLYLCSITLYFCFFLISSRFFLSKMLICFCNSCTDCFILLFHHGTLTAFSSLVWFEAYFFPTKMKHALISLLVSIILSDLISIRKAFTFIFQSLSKFLCTFLTLFRMGLFRPAHK